MISSYTSLLVLALIILALIVVLLAATSRLRSSNPAERLTHTQQNVREQHSRDPRQPHDVVVSKVCLGFEVSLTMQNGEGLTLLVQTEGDISVRIGGETIYDRPGVLRPASVAFLYRLLNKPGSISRIAIEGSDLVISEPDGNAMTFHGSDQYMSWQVWGKGNTEIIGCYPEHDVAFDPGVGHTWETWF